MNFHWFGRFQRGTESSSSDSDTDDREHEQRREPKETDQSTTPNENPLLNKILDNGEQIDESTLPVLEVKKVVAEKDEPNVCISLFIHLFVYSTLPFFFSYLHLNIK
jgi:hypothetical protein